jgi:hypothetical protein
MLTTAAYRLIALRVNRRAIRGIGLALLAALAGASALPAQTVFDDWRIRFPNPPANTLRTALHAEGRFVAAGDHATVVTSVTGNVWETQFLEPGFTATGLAFAGGVYVMTDRGGKVAVSTDLKAWRIDAIQASSLTDLIHAEGRFVAAGHASQVFFSADGDDWSSSKVAEESLRLEGIAYGAGQYVTVARGGKIHRSTDLEQWTEVFAGFPDTENLTDNWSGMAWFNGRFIAYGPIDRLLVSDDGTSWDEIALDFESSLEDHVEWNGRLWISGNSDAVLHSADGLSWSRAPLEIDVSANAIAAAPDRLVALASGGEVYSSDDGLAWTKTVGREFGDIVGLAYQNQTYVAIADKKRFLRSVDGVNWEVVFDARAGNDLYEGIGAVGGRFVAVSSRGRLAWSADGLDWNTETSVTFSAIVRQVSEANGLLFAGCDSGYLAHTADGVNWSERRIRAAGNGSLFTVEQVSHFNGAYFAAGGNGLLARSTDLETWEVIPLGGATAAFRKLLYFNNRYILLPVSGSRLLFSEDLSSWTDDRRVPVIRATGGWIFEDRVVVSSLSGLYTSVDGAAFVEHPLPSAGFRAIVHDGSQYVAAGGAAVIATTGSLPLSALQLAVEGKGAVSRSPDQALYDTATVVRLSAAPAAGQQFLWWETADGADPSPFLDLVLTTDTNVKAVFASLQPPSPALITAPGSVSLQWVPRDGWLLHHSDNLVEWSQTPGVQLQDGLGRLDFALPETANRFYQFRLREP